MQFESKSLEILASALKQMEKGFTDLPDASQQYDYPAIAKVIQEVAGKMQDNYPYHHPYYAGQMLKPPHPVARLAYMLSLWINPNNHAIDGGRASSRMEKEAVTEIARMFGWEKHLGHLTGGGTMANLEALWVAGKLHPDKLIVASEMAHYTHSRISEVLKLPFQSISCNSQAHMDLPALEKVLKTGPDWYSGGHYRFHGRRDHRPFAGNSEIERKICFPAARRRRLRRLFHFN